jgi:sugar O-acyltransferase (sialic acid O-acetyltransferase NeuD family)
MKGVIMKELIIIGAGGFGREVLQYALDMKASSESIKWNIAGFIDDNLSALDGYECEYEVLGKISDHKISPNNVYLCAIGNPLIKMKICQDFLSRGAQFINIIHPTAQIGRTCKFGVGNVFCPYSVITTDVTIGDFVFINLHSSCGHDAVIQSGCTLSSYCDITGYVKLEQGVFLGSHASVCPSVNVGSYAKIGAGATVISDIPPNCTAVGVPAKVVKFNKYEDIR